MPLAVAPHPRADSAPRLCDGAELRIRGAATAHRSDVVASHLHAVGMPHLHAAGMPHLHTVGMPHLHAIGMPHLHAIGVPHLHAVGSPPNSSASRARRAAVPPPHLGTTRRMAPQSLAANGPGGHLPNQAGANRTEATPPHLALPRAVVGGDICPIKFRLRRRADAKGPRSGGRNLG